MNLLNANEDQVRAMLRGVPAELDHLLFEEAGRRRQARVVNASGGRPKMLRPCPTCKEKMGARELLRHRCPLKGAAVAKRREAAERRRGAKTAG